MTKNPQLVALNNVGQSIWYDDLSKSVLESGELKTLLESGVSGLTSNPTIFKVAIADSDDYDKDIRELSAGGSGIEAICEELMIRDVGVAADMLRPTYDETNGVDGYASIEVSPLLASETASTVEAAKRIWKKLDRPNIMIKVPATDEGVPAIRQIISEGINVNVTLIFSVDVYLEVMEAYISGLEDRNSRGEDVSNISSVASFFVSRVDAICEKHFDGKISEGSATAEDKEQFLGKVGIANSKLAYSAFEELFGSERFKKLGARVQRPLWASTGTKNPSFAPQLYVEELAGRDTVNTVPPKTLKAVMESATIGPRLHEGSLEAKELILKLKEHLSFDQLLVELQLAGVESFSDSYRELLGAIESEVKVVA